MRKVKNKCLHCGALIRRPYKGTSDKALFCDHSCAASFNNRGIVRAAAGVKRVLCAGTCGNTITVHKHASAKSARCYGCRLDGRRARKRERYATLTR